MIAKTEDTGLLPEATKNIIWEKYHGMRAFLYFHLLRSWGDVILHLTYTSGSTIDLANIKGCFAGNGSDSTYQRRHYCV